MRYFIFCCVVACGTTPAPEPVPTKIEAAITLAGLYCTSNRECQETTVKGWCGDADCRGPVADVELLDTCISTTAPGIIDADCWLLFR